MGEPTLGEVYRRLDEVARQLHALSVQMRDDRIANDSKFILKEVYGPLHTALGERVDDLEAVNRRHTREHAERDKEARDYRQQVMLVVLAGGTSAVLSLIVSAYAVLGGR